MTITPPVIELNNASINYHKDGLHHRRVSLAAPNTALVPQRKKSNGEPHIRLSRSKTMITNRRERQTWMDTERQKLIAYEYLCHLEEAKIWIEKCIGNELPASVLLEDELRNGVDLAKLSRFFAQDYMKRKKIYDESKEIFKTKGLHFRHTDNINYWFQAMESVGLPKVFFPNTTDLYDKKNLPKVIYCIHGLSHFLYKNNNSPKIDNLLGKAEFTEEEISKINKTLVESGVKMPQFSKLGGILAKELSGSEAELHTAVIAINEAVLKENYELTFNCLINPHAGLEELNNNNSQQYQMELLQAIQNKKTITEKIKINNNNNDNDNDNDNNVNVNDNNDKNDDNDNDNDEYYKLHLSQKEIQSVLWKVNGISALKKLNDAIQDDDPDLTLSCLQNPSLKFTNINTKFGQEYQNLLLREQNEKDKKFLKKNEIQNAINVINRNKSREEFLLNNEDSITKVQALWRGKKGKETFEILKKEKETLYIDNLDIIIKIQAFGLGYLQRKKYQELLKKQIEINIVILKVQSWWRGAHLRKEFLARKELHKQNEVSIKRVQTWFKSRQANRNFHDVMDNKSDPTVQSLGKFLNTINRSDHDLAEELELQELHNQVVKGIRENQVIEEHLEETDSKIGLLLRNRITINEVVKQEKKAKMKIKRKKISKMVSEEYLKSSFSLVDHKEAKNRTVLLQQLFYLLQTHPSYLAKMLYLPRVGTNKFLQFLVLTLYNFAQTDRDEYLLLKVIKRAFDEEFERVDSVKGYFTGQALVTKLVVEYNRGVSHQSYLKELLQPFFKDVLKDENLNVNTQVVESCKRWASKRETETGESMNLKPDLNVLEALEIEGFREYYCDQTKNLIEICDEFWNRVNATVNNLPYGIRHIASYVKENLQKKFPETCKEELIKVVGHLVFFKYISPAIVAPDAFHLLDNPTESDDIQKLEINPDQRRFLGQISKIVQLVTLNSHLAHFDQPVLLELNTYITKAHQKLVATLKKIIEVPESEEYFNVSQYSDLTMMTKPTICVTGADIKQTHQIIWDSRHNVCPDEKDPLRVTVELLGEPELRVNEGLDNNEMESNTSLEDSEQITLHLQPKLDAAGEQKAKMKILFVKTKGLVVAIIRCQVGPNLSAILNTPAKPEELYLHEKHVIALKEMKEKTTNQNKESVWFEMIVASMGDLEELKRIVKTYLNTLADYGLVSEENNYQDMLNAIAIDIRNHESIKKQRKREINKLKTTKKLLDRKGRYFEEQQSVYETYIKQIKEQMGTGLSTIKAKEATDKKKSRHSTVTKKFTAKKLHKMGVLLEIRGVNPALFKAIHFQITSAEIGVFEVKVTSTGDVKLGNAQILLDDLLKMQVDGVAQHQIEELLVNVNLLIFLLNKTFYSGSKK